MSTLTKVFVVLTSVLAIALSCLFIAAAAQWNNWKALAQDYRTARDAAITQAQSTSASMQAALALKDEALAAKERELSDAQNRTQQLADDKAQLTSELAQARNERLTAEAGRVKTLEILDVQTAELKASQKHNQTLLSQNMDLQARNNRLNARVLDMTTNMTIAQDQVRNLQEKLYALEQSRGGTPPITRQLGAAVQEELGAEAVQPMVAGDIRGEVTFVEGAYANINVGESAGVTPGMLFMVYRDRDYVGDLIVERVRPGESGGRLSTLAQGGIRTGDRVWHGIE